VVTCAVLVSAMAAGAKKKPEAPRLIVVGPMNRPLLVADLAGALRTPVLVYSDAAVEEYVPDLTGPEWVQENGKLFVDSGKYETLFYSYDVKRKTNARVLLAVDTRGDTVTAKSPAGENPMTMPLAKAEPKIGQAVTAITAIIKTEVGKYYGKADKPPQASLSNSATYKPPRTIHSVDPQFSEEARAERFSGTVLLGLIVDENGAPRKIRVIKSVGHGLDEQALIALQQYRFAPGTKDGKPVAMWIQVEISFLYH
jgi:TonB family protein